jgi:hypothetical protein
LNELKEVHPLNKHTFARYRVSHIRDSASVSAEQDFIQRILFVHLPVTFTNASGGMMEWATNIEEVAVSWKHL